MTKGRHNDEVPGNAYASAVAVQKQMVRLAETVYRLDERLQDLFENEVDIKQIKFIAPRMDKSGWLAVVTATVDGKDAVAFHGGEDFTEALKGVLDRLGNGSLKWKEDK